MTACSFLPSMSSSTIYEIRVKSSGFISFSSSEGVYRLLVSAVNYRRHAAFAAHVLAPLFPEILALSAFNLNGFHLYVIV